MCFEKKLVSENSDFNYGSSHLKDVRPHRFVEGPGRGSLSEDHYCLGECERVEVLVVMIILIFLASYHQHQSGDHHRSPQAAGGSGPERRSGVVGVGSDWSW